MHSKPELNYESQGLGQHGDSGSASRVPCAMRTDAQDAGRRGLWLPGTKIRVLRRTAALEKIRRHTEVFKSLLAPREMR